MELDEMRAARDRLDAEIRAAEKNTAAAWNSVLPDCEEALGGYLRVAGIMPGVRSRGRKNEVIWEVGEGELTVTFAYDDTQHGPGLSLAAGGAVRVEWKRPPDPKLLVILAAALLGRLS
jgi:hypothetical protein